MNAFPSPRDPKTGSDDKGMSLKDYFAAHAMQAMIAEPSLKIAGQPENAHVIHRRVGAQGMKAYQLAEAMLKARGL